MNAALSLLANKHCSSPAQPKPKPVRVVAENTATTAHHHDDSKTRGRTQLDAQLQGIKLNRLQNDEAYTNDYFNSL